MIRFLYNLVWPIGLLVFLPGYLRKMFRRGGYRRKFGQRLAFYDRNVRDRLKSQNSIWLHAVSVGEVAIALKLARAIVYLKPDARFALTTTTTTGFAFAEKNAPAEIEVLYSPLDFWPVMRRAFVTIKPARVVLVEAEAWPNFLAETRKRNVPVALVNARLSPRSDRRFRRFRWFVAPMFRLLDLVCVQEQADVARWIRLGVRLDAIQLTGSIKYDPDDEVKPTDSLASAAAPPDFFSDEQLVLFGGSTHRGEEETLARAFLELRQEFPNLILFIAPRHVERCGEIKKALEHLSVRVSLRSERDRRDSAPGCFLLDRTGELARWYQIATVVFVGKSLCAKGGQNPVEPILAGKPVIFGPHMENFASLARELLIGNAAIEVNDAASLGAAVSKLLRNPDERLRLVNNARQVLDLHRGATARTAKLVVDL